MNAITFSPGHIGRLTARNRLVHAPLVRNYADRDGRATPRYCAHLARIAAGGVGTIIVESAYVTAGGKAFRNQLGLHDDAVLPALRELVHAVHRHGALVGIQLSHGGRQAPQRISLSPPVAPSAVPDPVINELPRALSVAEIGELVAAFGAAAARARSAGFDFVELHAADGFLIAEFLSPFSNSRDDDYGGTPHGRRRFLREVYGAVRAATEPDYPVTLRLTGEEPLPGGMTLEESVAAAREMAELGVAAIQVSDGNYATFVQGRSVPPMAVPDGVGLPSTTRIKHAVQVPVIAVGKLRSPAKVEAVLASGVADFVALGRGLLADPDWPAKAQRGATSELRMCVACNQGCISRILEQRDLRCTVNPEVGREQGFGKLAGGDGRKLVVIGGGPAGMAAARWGALAGFSVELLEADEELGGQLRAAAAAPFREEWMELRAWLLDELERLAVVVRTGIRANVNDVAKLRPWAIVVATGAEPVRPEVPQRGTLRVVPSRDLLEGKVAHHGRVVVAGGNCNGAQTSEFLAARGHRVTLIDPGADFASDAPIDERHLLLQRLEERGVEMFANARLVSIRPDHVVVSTPRGFVEIAADMLVTCLGARPVDGLVPGLREMCSRVKVVGDAREPRKITDAVAEGAGAVLELLDAERSRVAA